MHRFSRFLVVAAVFVAVGCGTDDDGSDANGSLPAADTMYLADPSDASSSSQALCASDTLAYDTLHALIEANNEAIADAIALIKTVVKAQQVKLETTGQVSFTASGSQRSLTFVASEQDDNSVTYVATFEGPNVSAYTLLEGSANADRTAGSWQILKIDGTTAVTVTWTKSGDDLHVVRTVTGSDRTATYDRVDTEASIVFAGANNQADAAWDTTTGDGSVTVNGEAKACFSKTSSDFCTEPCSS